MLDLILFSSSVAITNYVGRKNPMLSRSRRRRGGATERSSSSSSSVPRFIFHVTLLLSLLLFSVSILEAAPATWLVLIDGNDGSGSGSGSGSGPSSSSSSSTFVAWYRALLWTMCSSLLVVHPSYLGATIGASAWANVVGTFADRRTSQSSSSSPSSSKVPPSPIRKNGKQEGRRGRCRPLIICMNILWIGARFFVVSMAWRLLRKTAGAIIPYRITRVDRGGGVVARNTRKSRWHRAYCASSGTVVPALISLLLSLLSLATVGSFVLKFHAEEDAGNGGISQQRQHRVATITATTNLLQYMVSVLCAFGMIVASLLNGFGCASLPHANLAGAFLEPVPPSTIAGVEEDLRHAAKALEDKRWMLADAISSPSATAAAAVVSFTPSKNRVSSSDNDSGRRKRTRQLREEIAFLRTLVGDMEDDLDEMRRSQKLASDARTGMGIARRALGYAFSVVLVVRVVLAANSFVSFAARGNDDEDDNGGESSRRSDPLTTASLWLLGRNVVRTREQCELFRQGTSLVLAGALSASQVRNFFRVVGTLGRRLGAASSFSSAAAGRGDADDGRRGGGDDAALVLSSFVMGCYFLACVVVLKLTLPVEYRSSFSDAVALNFDFDARFLNVVFFGSACMSAVALASLFGIQRKHSERYRLESQLSSLSSQLA